MKNTSEEEKSTQPSKSSEWVFAGKLKFETHESLEWKKY